MIHKLLLIAFFSALITSCNPKVPRANRLEEDIEKIERESTPHADNYGPIPT